MPITCNLAFANAPSITGLLRKVPYIANILASTEAPANTAIHIDVYNVAIIEDIYANINVIASEDASFLQAYEHLEIYWPEDLKIPNLNQEYLKDFIGKWNYNFIRYIKYVAQESKSRIALYYLHERGDFPYEEAEWEFIYKDSTKIRESFSITNYDVSEWKASICLTDQDKVVTSFEGESWDGE